MVSLLHHWLIGSFVVSGKAWLEKYSAHSASNSCDCIEKSETIPDWAHLLDVVAPDAVGHAHDAVLPVRTLHHHWGERCALSMRHNALTAANSALFSKVRLPK